jgi:hypothetical protein
MSYSATSPYHTTNIVNNQFLDVMSNRVIPGTANDVYWEITPTYNLRPDLLASDMYDDSRLWWVFAQRNPNTLKDPLSDFVTGTKIFIPSKETLKQALGL